MRVQRPWRERGGLSISRRRKRHSPEQIIQKLRDGDALLAAGKTIGEVGQAWEPREQTFHRWRNQYGGMKAEEAKRLKKLLAKAELDKAILREALEGILTSPARRREAVRESQRELGVSERRACRALGQARATQRYRPRPRELERRRAEHQDHVWAWDFIHDRTRDDRPLMWLTLVDEFTREDLALEVGHRMRAEDVIDVLAELFT